MNKIAKMRVCDWSLIVTLLLMLGSSIQLEVTEGSSRTWVWIHIVLGVIFLTGIGWHLYEHFQWKNWINRLRKQKSPVTRLLAVFYALTLLTAIITVIHWIGTYTHSPIGGVHGKIGFIFLALCIGHTLKRRKSPVLIDKKK